MIFPAVLNMSLTASVAILAVLVARLALKKAPKVLSYALWAVVLFRLLCPVSLSVDVSLIPRQVASGEIVSDWTEEEIPQQSFSASYDQLVQELPGDAGSEPGVSWLPVLQGIWLCGIGVLMLYHLVSYIRLRRRLVGAVRWVDRVYLADHIESAFVVGLIRPRIYVPSSLGVGEQGCIIAHERHHIRRFDHVIKAVAFAALCLHWFNPLVWLAFVLAGQDMEMSCDEAVVKKLGERVRPDYSSYLLSLSTGRRFMPLAFGGGDTGTRIRNLALWKKPKAWATALCAAACVPLIAVCAMNPVYVEPVEYGVYYPQLRLYGGHEDVQTQFDGQCCIITKDGFHILNGSDEVILSEPWDRSWQKLPWSEAEWEAMLDPGEMGIYDLHRDWHRLLYQPINENHCLLHRDGDILLMTMAQSGEGPSEIFLLTQPDQSARWHMPWAINWAEEDEIDWDDENMPYVVAYDYPCFSFILDMEYTTVHASAQGGQLLSHEAFDTFESVTLAGDEELCWHPADVASDVDKVYQGVVDVRVMDGRKTVSVFQIHIVGENLGRYQPTRYTATLIGEGLQMLQHGDGTAIIRKE